MALRRRAAEHTVRYASLIQMFINALSVLKSMDAKVLHSSGGGVNGSFEIEATKKVSMRTNRKHASNIFYEYFFQINDIFGEPLQRKEAFHRNGVPMQPLQIDIQAATSAVELVFSLLLPQAVLLFNYAAWHKNQSNEETPVANTKMKMKMTKEGKSAFQREKFIMELNYKFFHKSCITDRYFRQKRLLVDHVLTDLVQRRLLHEGYDETAFFDTGRSSSIKTYLKFIPTTDDE